MGRRRSPSLLREYTVHPVSRALLHADFVEIKLDKPVDVEVPFLCKGKAAGVVLGGILRQVYRKLPIRCSARARSRCIIEYDVTALNLGDHVKASELRFPPVSRCVSPPTKRSPVSSPPRKRSPRTSRPPTPGAVAGAAPAAGAAAPRSRVLLPRARSDKKPAAAAAGKDKKK